MSRGAIACGADGLIIEVHSNPELSYSDGKQTVTLDQFKDIFADIKNISYAMSHRSREQAGQEDCLGNKGGELGKQAQQPSKMKYQF